jgi:hypothetical protein
MADVMVLIRVFGLDNLPNDVQTWEFLLHALYFWGVSLWPSQLVGGAVFGLGGLQLAVTFLDWACTCLSATDVEMASDIWMT